MVQLQTELQLLKRFHYKCICLSYYFPPFTNVKLHKITCIHGIIYYIHKLNEETCS